MPTKTSHWIFADTTERDGQLDVVDGDIAYVQADNTVYAYNGTSWSAVGAGGAPVAFFVPDAPKAVPETEDDVIDGTANFDQPFTGRVLAAPAV